MPAKGTTLTTYYLDNVARGTAADVGRLATKRPTRVGRDRLSCTWCGLTATGSPTDALSLRYDAPPVTRDTTLAGNVAVKVYANFDRDDAALAVNLIDVAPDGSGAHIANGQLRARDRAVDPRKSIYAPDGKLLDAYHPLTAAAQHVVQGVASYQVALTPAARVIAKGHHLQVRVSFTDSKYQLPAPLLAQMAGASMDVIHGGRYASEITVPVITGPSVEKRSTFTRSAAPVDRVKAAGTKPSTSAPSSSSPAPAPGGPAQGSAQQRKAPPAVATATFTSTASQAPWTGDTTLLLLVVTGALASVTLARLVRRGQGKPRPRLTRRVISMACSRQNPLRPPDPLRANGRRRHRAEAGKRA